MPILRPAFLQICIFELFRTLIGRCFVNALEPSARLLFRAALVIFMVTIVIGILNGMDLWEPSHNLLMTHVHSGTLGWITLAVVGAALLMFGEGADSRSVASSRTVALVSIAAAVLYVVTFATTTGVLRPLAGTFMLVAIVWVLIWVWARFRDSARTTAQLGVLLAMVSLTIGAILGVLLGLFIARGSIPGLSDDLAASFAGAHPPAMLIGYLVLAGAAVTHWLLSGSESKAGKFVVWALFAGGIAANLAFIIDVDALIQVATVLEVIAIITLAVHLWPQIKPSAWGGGGAANFARLSVVFLLVGIVLLVYVVQLVTSGELNPETGEGPVYILLAFDHAMFIGVMTNALFALISRSSPAQGLGPIMWAVNGGLALFLLGLILDTAILKQIGAPVMGLALLYAIYVFLRQTQPTRPVPTG